MIGVHFHRELVTLGPEWNVPQCPIQVVDLAGQPPALHIAGFELDQALHQVLNPCFDDTALPLENFVDLGGTAVLAFPCVALRITFARLLVETRCELLQRLLSELPAGARSFQLLSQALEFVLLLALAVYQLPELLIQTSLSLPQPVTRPLEFPYVVALDAVFLLAKLLRPDLENRQTRGACNHVPQAAALRPRAI